MQYYDGTFSNHDLTQEESMSYPRLFLDTANLTELREAVATGIVDGIATNPEKIASAGKSYREVISEIREFFAGPIAVQSMGKTAKDITDHALELHEMDPNLAVKVTCSTEGIKAIRELIPKGVRTNCTLVFTAAQGFAAGLAGSTFISPFVGRSEMAGYDGIELIRQIRTIYDAYGFETCIVAASLKSVHQMTLSILAGAHAVAVTWPIFYSMLNHPLTEQGYRGFEEIFKSIPSR
jgi:transaldolase